MEPESANSTDNQQIQVAVDEPELKNQLGGANKYYVYHIHGKDKFSQFSIYRRYSDFVILKESMMSRWPGVYIPSLPQKKFIGNNESGFVHFRKTGLQNFLRMIADVKFLWFSDEFQLFIKNNSSDVEKSLGNLGKTNLREIATKYEGVFPQLLKENLDKGQSTVAMSTKINQFKAYLKNTITILQKVAKVSEQMAQHRRRFQEKYITFLSTFLSSYQQKCISQYIDEDSPIDQKQSLYFLNQKQNQIAEQVEQLQKSYKTNALAIANELIKQQLRQIVNFQQILTQKDYYQSIRHKAVGKVKDLQLEQTKINAGKESIVSKIKKMTKQEQLKVNTQALDKAKEQEKQAQHISKIIDITLSEEQIDKFKKIRVANYYKIVREMSKAEKDNYEIEEELWNKIAGFQGSGFNVPNSAEKKKNKKSKQNKDNQQDKKEEQRTKGQEAQNSYKQQQGQQQNKPHSSGYGELVEEDNSPVNLPQANDHKEGDQQSQQQQEQHKKQREQREPNNQQANTEQKDEKEDENGQNKVPDQ